MMRYGLRRLMSAVSLVSALTGCGSRTIETTEVEAFPPTFKAIRDRILVPRCANCHAKIVSHTALLDDLVVPGKPHESSLFTETESGSMPRYSKPLDEPEMTALKTWIEGGALND